MYFSITLQSSWTHTTRNRCDIRTFGRYFVKIDIAFQSEAAFSAFVFHSGYTYINYYSSLFYHVALQIPVFLWRPRQYLPVDKFLLDILFVSGKW